MPAMIAFHVLGRLLAAWAVGLAAVGVKGPDFPQSQASLRAGGAGGGAVLVLS